MEENLQGARLHTAEHIFARALQDQNLDIHVRKADTYNENDIGKAYIKEIISFEKIKNAEMTVNEKIEQGLIINEETFETLEEAIKQNPKLRFNEERLDGKKEIRVVSIGDYDYSACKHRHVKNTKDIICFAIDRISYLGGETEIEFLAGTDAKEYLLSMKNAVIENAMKYHFIPKELQKHIEKQKETIEELEKEEKEMLYSILDKSNDIIELKNVKLSKFYNEISSIVRKQTNRIIAITNGIQITILKGKDAKINLIELGEKLKKKGFSGSINESAINGKADENIIEELKKEWKA
ncbi:MAG: hypothetical protein QXL94_08855 [Candidatus Parvarchaeum sp.]